MREGMERHASEVRLEEQALLEQAAQSAGLSDFGDEGFREGLRVLLQALEGEAQLSASGRVFAQSEILRHLDNRLRVTDDFKRHPEILEVEIEKPIFIVSPPRTGSTILHHLMAQDPDSRYVAAWECNLPSPPPELASYDTDPRIEQWERAMARTYGIELSNLQAMHPMGARLPEECHPLVALGFKSQLFTYQFNVPSYELWLESIDQSPIYATQKRMLQYLQWRCPRERWVLKSVSHVWALEEIFEHFPDARVVQTHRDPLKFLGSLISLMSVTLSMTSDEVDLCAVGASWAASWARALEKTIAFRDSGAVPEARFFDVHYGEALKDHVGMIRRIYEHFGLPFTHRAETRITAFLAGNPKDKHGAHSYELEDFGLDPVAERERYRFYEERFQVAQEQQS